jgi:hypothetical protein
VFPVKVSGTRDVLRTNPVDALSEVLVCGRSLAGIAVFDFRQRLESLSVVNFVYCQVEFSAMSQRSPTECLYVSLSVISCKISLCTYRVRNRGVKIRKKGLSN